MDDPSPTDLAARRAERARRNGARSRGPATGRGKARSSRNALRHGLTAKVHLVLDRDDEAGFMALADGLDAELAPHGTIEGFLVARLTAAMWHTGRAERMEARAFAAATDPDPDRLRLAMRYGGSVQRELFRCLRALQELRRHPLASVEAEAAGTAEPDHHDAAPPIVDSARVAVAAWGGERADSVPPGFLELRPVPKVWPIAWRFVQDRAFPGDVPLLVYADGSVRSPEGRLLEDVWSPDGPLPGAPRPAVTPPPAPMPPAPMLATAPMLPAAAINPAVADETTSALDGEDEDEGDLDALVPGSQRRNEPTQPFAGTRFPVSPNPPGEELVAPQIGLGRTAPELGPVPAGPDMPAAPDPVPMDGGDPSPPPAPWHPPSRSEWERMWGVTPIEAEPATVALSNGTPRPDAGGTQEQNCTHEKLLPCTPESEEPDRHEEKYTNELSSCPCEPDSEAEADLRLSEALVPRSLHQPDHPAVQPSGRRGRIHRRRSTLPRWQHAAVPEAGE